MNHRPSTNVASAALLLLSMTLVGDRGAEATPGTTDATHLEQVEADANVAFGAGDWKTALPLYEALTEGRPEDATAWFRFALATLETGNASSRAVAAYRKAIDLGYAAGPALYGIARAQARAKEPATFETLSELVALGSSRGLAQRLQANSEFDWLRTDSRFQEAIQQLLPCTADEFRQFDFWIGDWDVENPQGQVVGHNLISNSLDGCLVLEEWESQSGHKGLSLNYFDDVDETWTQIFRDNTGRIANWPNLEGTFRNGSMILESDPDLPSRSRWTWTRITTGKVRQMAEASTDGGKTWTVTWDSYYVRRSQ